MPTCNSAVLLSQALTPLVVKFLVFINFKFLLYLALSCYLLSHFIMSSIIIHLVLKTC